MSTVNIFQAKITLSKLIKQIETGQDEEIVIARHGRPGARPPSGDRACGRSSSMAFGIVLKEAGVSRTEAFQALKAAGITVHG